MHPGRVRPHSGRLLSKEGVISTYRSPHWSGFMRDASSSRIQRLAKSLDRLLHRCSWHFEQPAIGFVQFEDEEYRTADGE